MLGSRELGRRGANLEGLWCRGDWRIRVLGIRGLGNREYRVGWSDFFSLTEDGT